jgi:uncharacterized protein DUF4214
MRRLRGCNALLVAGLVSALSLTSLAGTASASGVAVAITAVEGQVFSGTVADYTSGVTANERFVLQAYLDLLGRQPSPTELAFFDALLGSGGTRTDVAAALLASDEYRSALVASIYDAYLRRTPTSTEVAVAVTLLGSGATDEQLRALVLGSAEYFQNQGGGTVDGFLHALFSDALGRPLDSASEVLYLALSTTQTRAEIALDVLTSSEARAGLVTRLFDQFLHRSPSPSDLQVFVTALQSGATDENVIADLVGSDEYFANVPAFASATIDWGDGTPASPGTIAGGAVSGSHTYADESTHTVTVTVDDLDGTFTIISTATVNDAALSATPAPFVVAKRTVFSGTVATFTDANPAADVGNFTASIDWGDGQVTTGAVSAQPLGTFAVAGSHSYKAKGDYPVTVQVQDVGGSTATVSGNATVTNKSGK